METLTSSILLAWDLHPHLSPSQLCPGFLSSVRAFDFSKTSVHAASPCAQVAHELVSPIPTWGSTPSSSGFSY